MLRPTFDLKYMHKLKVKPVSKCKEVVRVELGGRQRVSRAFNVSHVTAVAWCLGIPPINTMRTLFGMHLCYINEMHKGLY